MTNDINQLQAELKSIREEKRSAMARIEEVTFELTRKHASLTKSHANLVTMAQKIQANGAIKRRLTDLLNVVESHKLPPAVTKAEMKELINEISVLRERLIQETSRRLTLITTFDNLLGACKVYAVLSPEQLAQAKTLVGSGNSVKVESGNITVNLPTSKAPFKGLFSNATASFEVTSVLTRDKIPDAMVNLPVRNYIYTSTNVLFLGIGTDLGSRSIFGVDGSMQGSILELILSHIYPEPIDTEDYYLRFIGSSQKRPVQPVHIEAELRARGVDVGAVAAQQFTLKISAIGLQDNGLIDLLDAANNAISVVSIDDFSSFHFSEAAATAANSNGNANGNTKTGTPLLVGATKLISTGSEHAHSILTSILADTCLEVDTLILLLEVWTGTSCVSTIGLCQTYSTDAVKAYVTPDAIDEPLYNVFGSTLQSLFGPSSSANLLVFAGINIDDPAGIAATLEPVTGIQKPRTVAVRDFM